MKIHLWVFDPIVEATLGAFLGSLGSEVRVVASKEQLLGLGDPESLGREVLIAQCDGSRTERGRALQQLSRQNPGIPVLALLMPGNRMSTEDLIELGVHSCLHFPLSLADLEVALLRATNGHFSFKPSHAEHVETPAGNVPEHQRKSWQSRNGSSAAASASCGVIEFWSPEK